MDRLFQNPDNLEVHSPGNGSICRNKVKIRLTGGLDRQLFKKFSDVDREAPGIGRRHDADRLAGSRVAVDRFCVCEILDRYARIVKIPGQCFGYMAAVAGGGKLIYHALPFLIERFTLHECKEMALAERVLPLGGHAE